MKSEQMKPGGEGVLKTTRFRRRASEAGGKRPLRSWA
jgi:hypothetical protein